MFLMRLLDRFPATLRLSILMFVLSVGSIALTLGLVGVVLQRNLDAVTALAVLDDVKEYSAVYNKHGLDAIRDMFDPGEHSHHGVRVTSSTGSVIFEHIPEHLISYPWPQEEPEIPVSEYPMMFRFKRNSGYERLFLGVGKLNDGNYFWFGQTDASEKKFHRDILRQLWLAGLLAGVISVTPIIWFSREIVRPLRKFTSHAKAIAGGGDGQRLSAPRAVPELREFALAFNEGLKRIESLTQALQFANDQLAHELRTPLARLRGQLETFFTHANNDSAQEAATQAMEEIDRISNLLQCILDIRAGENGMLRLNRESTRLAEWLSTIVELYIPSAENRGIALIMDFQDDPEAFVDRQRLAQAISNLLDNALAHTPQHGTITLAIRVEGAFANISVSDTGSGLSENSAIWDRYKRGANSHALTPGMGLGLALVNVIVTSHGGMAAAANQPCGGAIFTISLPIVCADKNGNARKSDS